MLNGMFYEVYFDSEGVFRGSKLKSARMSELFTIQTVDKYENSIYFISQALEPYRSSLVIIPSKNPPSISVEVTIDMKDPPVITSLKFLARELLVGIEQAKFDGSAAWRLSFLQFDVKTLAEVLSDTWHMPRQQLKVNIAASIPKGIQLRLPEDKTIAMVIPSPGLD